MEAILPVLLFVAIAAAMSVGLVVGSSLIGPNKRTNRVKEMLQFYGNDVMLLIGGGLLAAGARMIEETALFVQTVAQHAHE